MRTLHKLLTASLLAHPALAQLCQTTDLIAGDPQANASLGTDVAISGDTLVSGAPNADYGVNGFYYRGAVYVWRRISSQWVPEAKISGPAYPTTYLGRAVAIDGDVMVASGFSLTSPYERAWVYRRTASAWNQEAELVPFDPLSSAAIQPRAVAVDGARIAVGHPRANGLGTENTRLSGAVYIYEPQGTTWVHAAKLAPASALPNDEIGMALAMRGGVLAFSQRPTGGNSVAHVYRWNGNLPLADGTLAPTNPGASSHFAIAIATDGQRIAVGDPGDLGLTGHQGAVHVYLRQSGVWVEEQLIRPAIPGGTNAAFGSEVAIDGDELLVSGTVPHRIWRFHRVGGSWVQQFDGVRVSGNVAALAIAGVDAAAGLDTATIGTLPQAGKVGIFRIGSQAAEYGIGLAGTGNRIPTLGAPSCPIVGAPFTADVGNAVGGSVGVLAYAFSPANLPLFGGTLNVYPILFTQQFTLGGSPGAAGVGTASTPLPLVSPVLVGLQLYVQGIVFDAGAVWGLSMTAGLQVMIG